MWQWNSQMPGLSATKRIRKLPPGRTVTTSRIIGIAGTAGVDAFWTKLPAFSSERDTSWKLCPCRWKGCLPMSLLLRTISTICPRSRICALALTP
jgi:hypothetical protein